MELPTWIVPTVVSIIVSLLTIAYLYGKSQQRLDAVAKKAEAIDIAAIHQRLITLEKEICKIDVLSASVEKISNVLYELKGMLESYMRQQNKE